MTAKKNRPHPNSMCPKFASTLARVPHSNLIALPVAIFALSHREARADSTRRAQQSKPKALGFLFYEHLYLRSAIKAEYKINRNDCARASSLGSPITRELRNPNYEFFPSKPLQAVCRARGEGRNLRPAINNRTPNISDG